jgi:hypothetical protein
VKVLPEPVAIWIRARGRLFLERVLQVADGDDLGGPQAGLDERRQGLQAGEEGVGNAWSGACAKAGAGVVGRVGCGGAGMHGGGRLPARLSAAAGQVLQPVGQGLGPVKGEDGAGAGLRVEAVGEVGFDASGFVAEGQGPHPGGQRGRQALRVAGRLHLDAGERGARLLGLDHAGGSGVDVKQVVGKAVAGVQGEFANRHATGGVDVGVGHVADVPAGGCEQRVDGLSGPGLRCHACAPLLRLILGERGAGFSHFQTILATSQRGMAIDCYCFSCTSDPEGTGLNRRRRTAPRRSCRSPACRRPFRPSARVGRPWASRPW